MCAEAAAAGDSNAAADVCRRALLGCREIGERWNTAECLASLARVSRSEGSPRGGRPPRRAGRLRSGAAPRNPDPPRSRLLEEVRGPPGRHRLRGPLGGGARPQLRGRRGARSPGHHDAQSIAVPSGLAPSPREAWWGKGRSRPWGSTRDADWTTPTGSWPEGSLGSRHDPPSGRGRYHHFHLVVDTLQGLFNCAINLGSTREHDVLYHLRRDLDLTTYPRPQALTRRRRPGSSLWSRSRNPAPRTSCATRSCSARPSRRPSPPAGAPPGTAPSSSR